MYEKTYGDFRYIESNDGIVITGYTGTNVMVCIPRQIDQKPVVKIGDSAFRDKSISSVCIPATVKCIGGSAFYDCKVAYLTIQCDKTKVGDHAFYSADFMEITIGSGIVFGHQAIEEPFEQYYAGNGRQAGTYQKQNVETPLKSFWTKVK